MYLEIYKLLQDSVSASSSLQLTRHYMHDDDRLICMVCYCNVYTISWPWRRADVPISRWVNYIHCLLAIFNYTPLKRCFACEWYCPCGVVVSIEITHYTCSLIISWLLANTCPVHRTVHITRIILSSSTVQVLLMDKGKQHRAANWRLLLIIHAHV